ncbi:fatty acid--CoA ligase family protein [Cohnella faecalis]|uniref:Long-chain fatty acid--CoA ligase n=1 Tax=Cohnella faecalis TaxID=2315694 RepID=A0A398CTT2_9BACL|nr:fatty acid--CoA ligase family protein [Cohnella faecalis]RIE02374.1 long-chain fatty acid--CoA ligase [Cohnella faecalis]
MHFDFLLEGFEQRRAESAIGWKDATYSYGWLLDRITEFEKRLEAEDGIAHSVVSLEGDYSPHTIAALFALIKLSSIIVPMDGNIPEAKRTEMLGVAEARTRVRAGEDGIEVISLDAEPPVNRWLDHLRQERAPGLVLFSSGSTGKSKAAVHHAGRLLWKFRLARSAKRTIPFMMFDHIGGLNTMLQSLAGGGCLYILQDRSPYEVCRTIEAHRIQALPVSPTFMNLLLLSGVHAEFDLSSLEVVSYGSEVMPESTLTAWKERFPSVRTVQAYGMSELGVLRTKSRTDDSLHFSLADDGVQYRIVDGMLEIKTATAMLGYLNAPDPFTSDGWLMTGDMAVEEGGFLRILGRRSDLINVGGEKVYPAEVESVLQLIANIEEVAVSGEPSAITGQIVKATVKLQGEESLKELRGRIWEFCKDKLPAWKIPQKIVITNDSMTSERMKKVRISQK